MVTQGLGGVGRPVLVGQAGRDPFGVLLADRDDVGAELAASVFGQHGGVLPGQPPSQLLADVGVGVVAAGAFADHRERLPAAG